MCSLVYKSLVKVLWRLSKLRFLDIPILIFQNKVFVNLSVLFTAHIIQMHLLLSNRRAETPESCTGYLRCWWTARSVERAAHSGMPGMPVCVCAWIPTECVFITWTVFQRFLISGCSSNSSRRPLSWRASITQHPPCAPIPICLCLC